nr:MAG TPA: hypothetical protein [Caudoviricetes sp.]
MSQRQVTINNDNTYTLLSLWRLSSVDVMQKPCLRRPSTTHLCLTCSALNSLHRQFMLCNINYSAINHRLNKCDLYTRIVGSVFGGVFMIAVINPRILIKKHWQIPVL